LINLQVAEKRQAKVKSEYAQELAQEYYQYVGAKASRAKQEGVRAEAEDFLQKGRVRFDKGLLTRLEVLNIESQVNQAKFQRATADNDVELARIKFIQKLGLEAQTRSVDVPETFEEPSLEAVDLEQAVQLALKNKPDILVNSLLVKFHEYEERIAIAKTKFKVDLSGFIGQSAAAFDTEPLDSGDDYFIGLKATRNWGPNSTNASDTKTKTSPRLGQTTRTESTVYSTELGLVDQLASLSEIKQAQVNLNKARRDLEEAKDGAIQEVQEAHISYEKARLQLDYAQQKIAFREEQVKILRAQAGVNEALPSQVLEAVMRLVEEKAGQAQALSNYYVALAKLNKAVGMSGYYK
jgi:outer membrane protein TolC